MAVFSYKVRTTGGAEIAGTMEAPEQRIVMDHLRAQKLIILEIAEAQKNALEDILNKLKELNPFKPKPTQKDLVLFSRQLSTLVSAGVPIVQGLNILGEQIENPAFKKVVTSVREDIESGVAIADAMKKHPSAFTELYVSMIRAGEIGGILDVILERLSGYLEAAEKLRGKVKGAMVYPIVVTVIAATVTIFLMVVIVPTFEGIFKGFGAELPLPTKVLIGISNFLKTKGWILGLIAGAGVFTFKNTVMKTEKGQKKVDALSLKIPVFGILLKKVAVAKFTRTLGTLIKSGVPILQALDTVGKTAGNKIVEEAIMSARESIREGERIADPLKKSGVFPPMVVQMISVGEETGNLDTMLTKIADFYDQEVDVAVNGLTAMIEPIVIVVMGIVIGAIVIAMFMPMFEMGGMVDKGT